MKIAILSDSHLGFGRGTERKGDAEIAFKESIEKIIEKNVDAVIFVGDLFDTPIPSSESFIFAIRNIAKFASIKNDVIVENTIGKNRLQKFSTMGIPFIAIHGNHERRSKGFENPVESIEDIGFLIHLHLQGIILKKDNERVAIQGMSYVPERYAKDVLLKWNPKPIENCKNILMLHQSIDRFIYSPLEPPTINLEDLPKGFDLILDGHIHKRETVLLGKTKFLICGSTVATQTKNEGQKGFYILDTKTMELKFFELKNQRKIFIFDIEKNHDEAIKEHLREILKNDYNMKPVIRFRLKGDFYFNEQEIAKFREKAIITISKEIKRKNYKLDKLEENNLSIEEFGKKLLKKNAKNIDTDMILDALMDENPFEKIYQKIGESIDKKS